MHLIRNCFEEHSLRRVALLFTNLVPTGAVIVPHVMIIYLLVPMKSNTRGLRVLFMQRQGTKALGNTDT